MIIFTTSIPDRLKRLFKNAVVDGAITTWLKTAADYYTHKAERWRGKAIVGFTPESNYLRVRIIRVEANCPVSEKTAVFSYYQGHLAETFCNHYGGIFSQAILTAEPTREDSNF